MKEPTVAAMEKPVPAHDLVKLAVQALERESLDQDGDDRRLGVLWMIDEHWASDDQRFAAAKALVGHDGRGGDLLNEVMGELVGIVDRLEDFTLDLTVNTVQTTAAAALRARELRASLE